MAAGGNEVNDADEGVESNHICNFRDTTIHVGVLVSLIGRREEEETNIQSKSNKVNKMITVRVSNMYLNFKGYLPI